MSAELLGFSAEDGERGLDQFLETEPDIVPLDVELGADNYVAKPAGSLALPHRAGNATTLGGVGWMWNANYGKDLVKATRRFIYLLLGLVALAVMGCVRGATASDVSFVIPLGTEAALERGDETAFRFPDDIQLLAGQSVVITNNDVAMHYFFDIPVAPGQTISKAFPRPGAFVYQGGFSCSISRTNSIRVKAE